MTGEGRMAGGCPSGRMSGGCPSGLASSGPTSLPRRVLPSRQASPSPDAIMAAMLPWWCPEVAVRPLQCHTRFIAALSPRAPHCLPFRSVRLSSNRARAGSDGHIACRPTAPWVGMELAQEQILFEPGPLRAPSAPLPVTPLVARCADLPRCRPRSTRPPVWIYVAQSCRASRASKSKTTGGARPLFSGPGSDEDGAIMFTYIETDRTLRYTEVVPLAHGEHLPVWHTEHVIPGHRSCFLRLPMRAIERCLLKRSGEEDYWRCFWGARHSSDLTRIYFRQWENTQIAEVISNCAGISQISRRYQRFRFGKRVVTVSSSSTQMGWSSIWELKNPSKDNTQQSAPSDTYNTDVIQIVRGLLQRDWFGWKQLVAG